MALNLNSSTRISNSDMANGDPSRLNRVLNLMAQKIPTEQSITQIVQTFITNNTSTSGGGSSGGGGTSAVTILSDTHANRLANFAATGYAVNSLFWETDRLVLYICQLPSLSSGNVWQYALGTMQDAYASRPTDLATDDTGFLFYATDKQLIYEWSGTAWSIYTNFEPLIQDTHANRLSGFPSTFYPTGTTFWETDRTVLYLDQNATGTLTATGTTTQTWTSGDQFDTTTNWVGKTITVAGVNFTVASITNATHIVTTASIPAVVGAPFTVASGKWQYATGQFNCTLADLPADLVSSDDGFLAGVTNYVHVLEWLETTPGWNWAPGESGSGYIQGFAVNPSPATGWALCNGAAGVSYLKADGTTATITVPNLTGTNAYGKFGSPYTGTINAATAPGVSGSTASGNAVIAAVNSGTSSAAIAGNTGNDSGTQTVAAGVGATVPAEPHTHGVGTIADSGHAHTVSTSDSGHTHAKGTLAADATGEPPNIILRPYFRR